MHNTVNHDGRSHNGLKRVYGNAHVQIVSTALKRLVRRNFHGYNEVSRCIPTYAGLSLSLNDKRLTGMNASGNIDTQVLVIGSTTFSPARFAGLINLFSGTGTLGANRLRLHLTENGFLNLHDRARSFAARARCYMSSFCHAGSVAVITGRQPVVGDCFMRATSGFLKSNGEMYGHIRAARPCMCTAVARPSSKE